MPTTDTAGNTTCGQPHSRGDAQVHMYDNDIYLAEILLHAS